jgi:hypothetical protein
MSIDTDTLRNVFLAWERKRVPYTIFVAVFNAWQIGHFPTSPGTEIWNLLLLVALTNVFFCIGPLVEAYVFLFAGIAIVRARTVLFGLGVFATALILALVL